jgi:ubiquinone biosynthesis protein
MTITATDRTTSIPDQDRALPDRSMLRALRLTFRFVLVVWVMLVAIGEYLILRMRAGELSPEAVERLRGVELARMFERLGATYVKFGQIMSTRPDLLGPGYIEGLSRLQDEVPADPFVEVEATLARELGTLRARIVELDETPLAAASVAQVHRGRLDTGEAVAIKVQRAAAEAQIDRDLWLLSLFASIVHRLPQIRPLSLPGAVERFAHAMQGQVDFRLEAANNRRFAESFVDVEGVEVPALFDALCTKRVLTMALVDGVRATAPEQVGHHRAELAQLGAEAVLKMVFVDGFVHADMHPGNIFLTREGHVVLLDLGLVAEIPDGLRKPWCLTFMALAQRNGEELARLFYAYAPEVDRVVDYAAFERDVVDFFDGFYGKNLGDVEVSVVVGGAMAILRRHRVQVDPVFTVVNLALLVAEGLGKQLDPSLDLVSMSFPYLMRALAYAPEGKPPLREIPSGIRGVAPDVG